MLFVDLDKTLIKSDFLLESFVRYFSKNIFAPILCLGVLITKGKVGLKEFLSNKSDISVENLPYNQQVLDAICQWKENYPKEKVILISATHQDVIERSNGCIDRFLHIFAISKVAVYPTAFHNKTR